MYGTIGKVRSKVEVKRSSVSGRSSFGRFPHCLTAAASGFLSLWDVGVSIEVVGATAQVFCVSVASNIAVTVGGQATKLSASGKVATVCKSK